MDKFTKLILLIIAGCLVVLVIRGITVTHKGKLNLDVTHFEPSSTSYSNPNNPLLKN